ncbi:MAG: carboxypeptidase regulatory-like domain-containing protein [Flavobacteriales bacterium]|nr:carboxypeptidase regulatory-like domain-containing protein [Flavobacteriales bacterium]
MIEVVSPYYCSPDLEIYAQPGDVVELPDQACYVRSYDLKLTVTQGACNYQMGGSGAPMGNVEVSVLRPTDHAPQAVPPDEGQNIDGTVTMPGLGEIPLVSRCSSKSSDGSALFNNMVFHDAYSPDEYLLKCSTDKDRGLYTYFTWSAPYPTGQSNGPNVDGDHRYLRNSGFEVLEYDVPVALVPRSPRVIGRVMVSVTQPLADATVKLRLYYDKAVGAVPPVVVGCDHNTETADFQYMEFKRTTDANGLFDFSNIVVKGSKDGMFFLGPHASIIVSKPGYRTMVRPLPSGSNETGFKPEQFNNSDPAHPKVDLKMGLQWDMTSGILLEPYGLVMGTIQDEDGKPVRCDVQVGDGPWGRSEAVMQSAAPSGNSGGQWMPSGVVQVPGSTLGSGVQQVAGPWMIQLPTGTSGGGGGQNQQPDYTQFPNGASGAGISTTVYASFSVVEQFKVPGPPGYRQIQLLPLSDQYFPLTVTRNVPVNVGTEPSDAGVFTVKEKRHRLRVELSSFAGPVVGAVVRLDDRQQTSDQAGVAYFEFLSPETEFRLKVDPPGDLMPVDRIITNPVSPDPIILKQSIENGTRLLGRVETGTSHDPVPGARVWVEIGADQYGPQMNQTTTDGNGNFVLPGVPMGPFTVHAAKSDSLVSYIGTSQAVTYGMVPGPPPDFKMIPKLPDVVLVLQRVEDLDLTTIHGFPVEVTARVKNSDGSSTISGAFVHLPGNANFHLEDPAQRITFSQIKVHPGPKNAQGVPHAVPVNDPVETDMTHVPLKLYTGLDVTLQGMPLGFFPARVQVQGTPQGGEVRGTVSSELSSFNFSYDFTGRFYLGDGPEQPLLDVFRSSTPYPQRSFNLMTLALGNMSLTWKPSNANFSLRSFPARSDREHSFVEPDVFRIATVVQVKDVPDLTPQMLELNVGDIRVTSTAIEGIQGGGAKLSFKLNNWSFTSTTPWTFSSELAAIVIPKGTLDMQLAKADMTQIMIRPNALEMNAQNLGEVRLGGVAPLIPEANVSWTFGYDPGYVYQGKTGVWRFGTLTAGNGTVATVQGPPELVPGKLQFSSFSLVSRGQPLAEVRALNYRYFNIMDMVPVGSMQFTPGGVDLLVNCSMAIHGLPQTTGFFSFFKDAGKTVSRLKPLGATVTTGRGNVYFKMDERMASQELKPGQFTCYGKFRIDPEDGASGDPVYAYGWLDHKVGNTFMDVIRTDDQHYKGSTRQEIQFGGSPDKKMLVNSGRQTMGTAQWDELAFKGNLLNMGGIADTPENELSFTVKGAVDLDQGKLAMSQLSTPFGDMNMSYDFQNARLVGSMDLSNNNFGAVNIVSAQLGLLVDKDGFLVSCYDSHVIVPPAPWPLQDHHPAFMIGAHNAIPDTLLSNMMADFRLKSLPSNMAGHKISGMYLQDKLSLIDFSVPSIDLLLLGVEGHASCAVEGRNWVDLSGGMGLGGMAYADVGMEFWLLSPLPNCSKVSVSAGVEMMFEAAYQNDVFTMTACGSAKAGAEICGFGDTVGLTVKGSVNSQGKLTLQRIDGSCGD